MAWLAATCRAMFWRRRVYRVVLSGNREMCIRDSYGIVEQKGWIMKKTKRTSNLTKFVVVAILVVVSISALIMQTRLASAERARDALQSLSLIHI